MLSVRTVTMTALTVTAFGLGWLAKTNAQQITEALPLNEVPRYLIRDRDGIYGVAVARRLRAMGIRDKPIAAASPCQNSFAERLIGTIRRECLEQTLFWTTADLETKLRDFQDYFNGYRAHTGLGGRLPEADVKGPTSPISIAS